MENNQEAILVEKVDSKVNIVISASSLDLFLLCKARFNYRTNLKKVLPLVQKSRSLDLGSLAHIGYETYFKSLAIGMHYQDRMQASLMKIREIASDPETSNILAEENGNEAFTHLLNTFEQNCDYWRHEDEHLEILAVETPFDYILFEDDYVRLIVSGKIDLLVNVPPLGRNSGYSNLPFDHKTYSRDFPLYRLSNQFINYAAVCNSNFLIVNRVGLQKSLKPEEKFKRVPLSYDPLIIQEWKDNTIKTILDEYLNCVREDSWPMNFTSCYKFNRLCEYYEVCDSSGKEAKIWKLESNYVDAPKWDKYQQEGD